MTGVGTEFEGYRIEAELGEGGFAQVFRAVDGAGRHVALKLLTRGKDGYEAATVGRFEREVAILSQLRSPHIVRLLRHGRTADGTLYLVFELLGGRDLVDLLDERARLRGGEVIAILRQVLAALDEAHRAGLLHRDLKPHNIRVVSEAPLDVRLIDFGIARSTDDGHPSVTKTGELIGTPRYMSPEQLMAQPLGPASDIYSLGVVAFELLMGRDALAENNVWSQVGRLRTGHSFSVSEQTTADRGLIAVIERMTARDVTERFGTARAVLVALDRQPGPSRPPASAAPAPERAPRRHVTVAIVVTLLLLATVGGAAVMSLRGDDVPPPPQLPQHVLEVEHARAPLGSGPASSTAPELELELVPPTPEHGSEGCGKDAPHVGRGKVFGEEVYVPDSYESYRAHPLLVLGHHKWDDPGTFMMTSGFADLADLRHFVILAPDNGNRAWEMPERFIPALEVMVDDVKKATCIDERRVYVVGHSRGGRAAMAAGCQPWVAGIAVNSYLPKVAEYRGRWWCERSVPTLWLSPTDSHMVRLDGTEGCVSPRITLPDFEAAWRERNACKPSATTEKVNGGMCRTWSCDARLKSCELEGGHYWPGVEPHTIDVGNCMGQGFEEPDAPRFATAEQVWQFFESIEP